MRQTGLCKQCRSVSDTAKCGVCLIRSRLFATQPNILDTSTGIKIDLFKPEKYGKELWYPKNKGEYRPQRGKLVPVEYMVNKVRSACVFVQSDHGLLKPFIYTQLLYETNGSHHTKTFLQIVCGQRRPANKIIGYYRMFQWRANTRRRLCACAGW